MEYILIILETISKYISMIDSDVLLVIVISLLAYIVKSNKTRDEKIEVKFKNLSLKDEEIIQMIGKQTAENNKKFAEIAEEIAEIKNEVMHEMKDRQDETQRMTLRGLITNVSLPKEYRLSCYDDYLKMNGNSWVSDYVEKNLKGSTKEE